MNLNNIMVYTNFRVNQTVSGFVGITDLDMTITDKPYLKEFLNKIGRIGDLLYDKYKSIHILTSTNVPGYIKFNIYLIDDNKDKKCLEDITEVDNRFCDATKNVIEEIIKSYKNPFNAFMYMEEEIDGNSCFTEFSVENVSFDSKYGHIVINKVSFTHEDMD